MTRLVAVDPVPARSPRRRHFPSRSGHVLFGRTSPEQREALTGSCRKGLTSVSPLYPAPGPHLSRPPSTARPSLSSCSRQHGVHEERQDALARGQERGQQASWGASLRLSGAAGREGAGRTCDPVLSRETVDASSQAQGRAGVEEPPSTSQEPQVLSTEQPLSRLISQQITALPPAPALSLLIMRLLGLSHRHHQSGLQECLRESVWGAGVGRTRRGRGWAGTLSLVLSVHPGNWGVRIWAQVVRTLLHLRSFPATGP